MLFRRGSLHLFQVNGIHVYVNWTWLLAAVFIIQQRSSGRMAPPVGSSIAWYLGLFGIVLLHEFGHALACKSVGGRAEQITLWPLGGIAFVDPPLRPGAVLWSIAAGPLVNVALIPVTLALWGIAYFIAGPQSEWALLAETLAGTNGALLVFNILPIYPLDGGQILQSLIWFITGRSMSLLIAAIIGLVGAAGIIGLGMLDFKDGFWLVFIGIFMILQSWQGVRYAKHLRGLESAPAHRGFACPWCGQAPPALFLWPCGSCGARFDIFATYGRCPNCNRGYAAVPCPFCNHPAPLERWGPEPRVVVVPPILTPVDAEVTLTDQDAVTKSDPPYQL